MKIKFKILGLFLMLVCFSFIAYAVPVQDVHDTLTKTEIFSKIDDEHKNTRKYFTDELTRQRTEFYKAIDDRAIFYEKEFNDVLTKTYFKLGLVWGGIVLFIVGLSHILKLKTERIRYNSLKNNLSLELKKELGLFVKSLESNIEKERIDIKEFKLELEKKSEDLLRSKSIEEKKSKDLTSLKGDKAKKKYLEKNQKKEENKRHSFSDNIKI